MSKLLKKPETPRDAFVQGFVMAAAIGTPAFLSRLLLFKAPLDFWPFAALLLLVAALFVGAIGGAWALIKQWAYQRVTTKDDPWDS